MDMEIYDAAMNAFGEILNTAGDNRKREKIMKIIGGFQLSIMRKFVKEMPDKTEAQRAVRDMFKHVVEGNRSGSSYVYGISKDAEEELQKLCYEEYGDFAEIKIAEAKNGTLTLEAIVYGNYVPFWDGFKE